jgi:hypothetical protein
VDARSSIVIKAGVIGAAIFVSYVTARAYSRGGLVGRSEDGGKAVEERATPSPGKPPTIEAATSAGRIVPLPDTTIQLPRLGSLDQQALAGRQTLRGLRGVVADAVAPAIAQRCRTLHTQGDTSVSVAVTAVISRGSVSLTRMGEIVVERGASITPELERCIQELPLPILLPSPVVRSRQTAQTRPARWPIADQSGDFVVRVSFRDSCR